MAFLKFFCLMVVGILFGLLLTMAGVASGNGFIGTGLVLIGWVGAAGICSYAGDQW